MEEQERVQRGNSLDSHQEFSMDYREDLDGSDTISANETCKRDVDDTIRNVLRGKLDNLPHPESNTVRIFLSSTFSDFKAERNILHQIAYPELRSYCCDLGLDLEVVDMRWGLTDDVINDHQVSALCIDEIVACQNVSCGPNFVMFLGNRYGYRPFPSKIPICEFEILQRIVEEENQESSHLLLDWFKKDENNVPPVYVLQPVHHQLPLDKASNQKIKKEMSKAKDEWNHIHDRLHELLMMAADKAYKQGRITKTAKHKYCTSVTEEEIRQGWLRSSNPNANVMCYIRNINDIEPHIEDSKDARMFIDVKVDEKTGRAMVDREAQELRESLIKTIRQNMNKENIKEYDLAWEGKCIDACTECGPYAAYLDQFAKDFVSDMKRLIEKREKIAKTRNSLSMHFTYEEALHHGHFAKRKIDIYHGNEDEIEKIKQYLQSSSVKGHSPLIVTGVSGVGKTALVAYVASKIHEWFVPDVILITRFLGTSPQSSELHDVVKSVLCQICLNYGYKLPDIGDKYVTSGEMRRLFCEMLEVFSQTPDHPPLVIILDSVDQLHDNSGVFNMSWLPKHLPVNVYMIISMLSDRYRCLENVKKRIPDQNKILSMTSLSEETADKITHSRLANHHKRLSAHQNNLLKNAFSECKNALFLQVVLDQAMGWSSYCNQEDLKLNSCVESAILHLFSCLEVRYGQTFVRHTLSFLTVSQGLTNIEMEDALSCDNLVLNEVFQYHDPPLAGCIQLPCLMWVRLQSALKEYLTTRKIDGKTVSTWYHRQFRETAEKRFLSNKEERIFFHSILADLFQQENGIKATIILEQRDNMMIKDADRCVTPQPLNETNLRKLNALPIHLYNAKRIKQLKNNCLFNFQWMFAKLRSSDCYSSMLCTIYQFWLEKEELKNDTDLCSITKLLTLCMMQLWSEPVSLPYLIINTLPLFQHSCSVMTTLVTDAKQWMAAYPDPLILPVHQISTPNLDSPVNTEMCLGSDGVLAAKGTMFIAMWSEMYADDTSLNFFDLEMNVLVESVKIDHVETITLDKEGEVVLISTWKNLILYDARTGDIIQKCDCVMKMFPHALVSSTAISLKGKYCAATTHCQKQCSVETTCHKVLCLVDIYSHKLFDTSLPTPAQDNQSTPALNFIAKDSKLLVTDAFQFYIYSVPHLNKLSVINTGAMMYHHILQVNCAATEFVIPVMADDDLIGLAVFDCERERLDIYREVYDEKSMIPFSLHCRKGKSVIGLKSQENETVLSIHERTSDKYSIIDITGNGNNEPCTTIISPDWELAFVGWKNGDVTVIDLKGMSELSCLSHTERLLHKMFINPRMRQLYSVFYDNEFRIWNIDDLVLKAKEKKMALSTANQGRSFPICRLHLDGKVECDDMAIMGESVLTFDIDTTGEHKLTVWKLESGYRDAAATNRIREAYKHSSTYSQTLSTSGEGSSTKLIPFDKNKLMVVRQNCSKLHVCIISEQSSSDDVTEISLDDVGAWIADCKQLLVLTNSGTFIQYDVPAFSMVSSTTLPKISDQMLKLETRQMDWNCRCLREVQILFTFDRRFVLILYPGQYGTTKVMDLIDLEKDLYMKRFPQLCSFHAKIYHINACAMLVMDPDSNIQPNILTPSEYYKQEKGFPYAQRLMRECCSVFGDMMVEVVKSRYKESLAIWRTEPLELIHTLYDETASCDISAVDISRDRLCLASANLHVLAVWCLETGQIICKFGLNMFVEKLTFNPSGSHIVAKATMGLKKKTCLIFKLRNI